MKALFFASFLILIGTSSCFLPRVPKRPLVYQSDSLIIEELTEGVYVHISFIDLETGPFPCNGMIVVNGNEAFVFDTPTTNAVSKELLDWIQNDLKKQTMGLVAHHFHEDCVGGLEEFKKRGIPSYVNQKTHALLQDEEAVLPTDTFEDSIQLKVGELKFEVRFMGEGHTLDNVVSYFPTKNLLFGGCLVKEVNAGRGNLNDANLSAWPQTIAKIQSYYPNLKHIVPGHGKPGGMELLVYTKGLFEK